jgi:adenylate kinase
MLTEEDFRKRRPHPNFKTQLALEKQVLRIKNDKVRPLIVASGLVYGNGEDWLHFLFKVRDMGTKLKVIVCLEE